MGTEAAVGTGWLRGRATLGGQEFLAWRDRAVGQVEHPHWPHLNREAWRGTEVQSVLEIPFRLAPELAPQLATKHNTGRVNPEPPPEFPYQVTLLNGQVQDHGELPPGVVVGDWEDLSLAERENLGRGLPADGLTALNQAAVPQVVVVRVMGNPIQPLRLHHLSQSWADPVLACPRYVVILAPATQLTLVTDYVSTGTSWTNGVVELHLGRGSRCEHYLVQQESLVSAHLLRVVVHQAQDSHYTLRTVSAGARWSRCEPVIIQCGTGTVTHLRGLTLVGGRQHSDMHSVITHNHPQGTSRQMHKCVVAQQGQAVFQGTVRVAQAAQLTDAGQLNQNLFLSKQARVDTRPQLEIQADNVKCTHGATVSDLDPSALFYLQSRGIDGFAARSLLVEGFAQELLQELPFPTLRQPCQTVIHQLTQTAMSTEATP